MHEIELSKYTCYAKTGYNYSVEDCKNFINMVIDLTFKYPAGSLTLKN